VPELLNFLKKLLMKKIIFILIGTFLLSCSQLMAQEKKGYEYWKMEHDPVYNILLKKQIAGDSLSVVEKSDLANYKSKLNTYFEGLSDDEKAIYFKNRAKWTGQPSIDEKVPFTLEPDVYSGERSKYSQYLISSGIFGFFYGASFNVFFDIYGGGASAIPLLAAGASTLIPVLSLKDKNVTYNSLALNFHGKTVGALQGAALGFLITGDNIDEGKLILALSTASSIALGRVGYNLGKNKPWTQGQAALYSHYGFIMPLEGLALMAAFEVDDPRLYGLSSLAFGAGGYYIADRVGKSYDFTRGDITAVTTFTSMNAILGFSIISDMAVRNETGPVTLLVPAIGAIGGTLLGQEWVKGAHLTNQQGRNVALATTGGAVIGLGLTAVFSPETGTPYYIVSYITGMTTYAILMNKYKTNFSKTALIDHDKKSKWNFGFMPQNILVNRKIASFALANPGKRVNFLPAFSASVTF
jgi:hypothetical protein